MLAVFTIEMTVPKQYSFIEVSHVPFLGLFVVLTQGRSLQEGPDRIVSRDKLFVCFSGDR